MSTAQQVGRLVTPNHTLCVISKTLQLAALLAPYLIARAACHLLPISEWGLNVPINASLTTASWGEQALLRTHGMGPSPCATEFGPCWFGQAQDLHGPSHITSRPTRSLLLLAFVAQHEVDPRT